ncbi:MAG: tetratricopeptide repeat protein [Planctomycetes bacterium]|nr:tetratricopeptide repeat protein [Planctomycetota bacterium]
MGAFDGLVKVLTDKNPNIDAMFTQRDEGIRNARSAHDAISVAAGWEGSRESQGMFLYLTGNQRRALAILESQAQSDAGKLCGAMAAFELNQPKLALKFLKGVKAERASLLSARANTQLGNLDDAEKQLKDLEGRDHDGSVKLAKAEYLLRNGELEAALESVESAIQTYGRKAHSLFQYAVVLTQIGDDKRAIEIYEEVAQMRPISVPALINLGVLYEDRGDFKHAIRCYRAILREYPNHRRALLYLKDAEASVDMFYDEDRERREDKRMQVLRTPCSDFELSVRSRNCLQKMGIDTLGDLIQRTESELLAYKNFGETSLDEIKAILGSKGLRLGMSLEEALRASSIDDALDRAKPKHEGVLAESVDALELSVRARRCMERIAIKTIGELTEHSEQQLLAAPNFGATSLIEVKRKLADLGLSLKA